MTIRTSALAAATLLVAVVPAAAQTITDHKGVITTTRTEQVGKRIDKITCREFLSLRDRFQPQTVSYAVGYTKAHKPEDAVYDISGIDRLTPVVVKTCQTRPEETLLQRIRTLLHRL